LTNTTVHQAKTKVNGNSVVLAQPGSTNFVMAAIVTGLGQQVVTTLIKMLHADVSLKQIQ
jgi:hypothetical protein